MSKHKHKQEKTPPLDIHNEVQEEFIVVYKKWFTKHGCQVVKQVSKLERILQRPASLELITHEKLQHIGIGSHLFYLNLQHGNVSLSFNKI
jgi:ubiquinone biosynthesis protein Coq4